MKHGRRCLLGFMSDVILGPRDGEHPDQDLATVMILLRLEAPGQAYPVDYDISNEILRDLSPYAGIATAEIPRGRLHAFCWPPLDFGGACGAPHR